MDASADGDADSERAPAASPTAADTPGAPAPPPAQQPVPLADAAPGAAAAAQPRELLVVRGQVGRDGSGKFFPFYRIPATPENARRAALLPREGTHQIRFYDAAGQVLKQIAWTPDFRDDDSPDQLRSRPFTWSLEPIEGVRRVVLSRGDQVLDTLLVAAAGPTIEKLKQEVLKAGDDNTPTSVRLTWDAERPRVGSTTLLANLDDTKAAREFDLRLMSSQNVSGIPAEGKNLFLVAAVDQVLYFRIFDRDGQMIVDTDEKRLTGQARQIEDLRKQLQSLWPPHKITRSEKDQVFEAVLSIVADTLALDQGKPLLHQVYYTNDGGKSWRLVATGLADTEANIRLEDLPGGPQCHFQIRTTDGYNVTAKTTEPLDLQDKAPLAEINAPRTGAKYRQGGGVLLIGRGYDREEGLLPDERLTWKSDVQGELGSGQNLVVRNLQLGKHRITLVARDSKGNEGNSEAVEIVVERR